MTRKEFLKSIRNSVNFIPQEDLLRSELEALIVKKMNYFPNFMGPSQSETTYRLGYFLTESSQAGEEARFSLQKVERGPSGKPVSLFVCDFEYSEDDKDNNIKIIERGRDVSMSDEDLKAQIERTKSTLVSILAKNDSQSETNAYDRDKPIGLHV